MHILISKIIRRSERLSPVKLASSPAKVDEQIATTSQTVDDTIYDISYDSGAELDLTASLCMSCNRLKKKIKTLQKTISWHKKTKATLQKKIKRLIKIKIEHYLRVNQVLARQLWTKPTSMKTMSKSILMMTPQWIICLLKNLVSLLLRWTKKLRKTLSGKAGNFLYLTCL